MRSSFFIIFFFAAILFYSPVNAATLFQQVGITSSPNPVGSGARAVGMGGAFISVADDATAASWNPAGLIQLENPELSIVGSYSYNQEAFSSSLHPERNNKQSYDNTNINYLSAAYPFRILSRNTVLSMNFQRLYEFKRSLSYNSILNVTGGDLLRDISFSQDGFIGAVGLASAIQITPRLSFGGTLNIWTEKLFWDNGWKETYSAHDIATLSGSPVITDTVITDEYSKFHGINANFGILWNANEQITVGAVLKTPFDASINHKFTNAQTQSNTPPTDPTVINEDITLRMPLSYGAGIALRVSDALSFAIDVYRTHWSNYMLTDGQGSKRSPIDGQLESDSTVKNTTQARIGMEYLFIGQKTVIPLRGGFFYDPEPSGGPVKDFFGITLGSGIAYKKLVFDAAYQFRWGNNVSTSNLIATTSADIKQHLLLISGIFHFQ